MTEVVIRDTCLCCDYDEQPLSELCRICWHLWFYRKIPRFRFHFYDFVSLITEGTIFRHSAIPCETCLALFCVKRRFCSGRLQNHLKKRVIMYLSYGSTFFIVNLTPKLNLLTLLLFKATKIITNSLTDQKKVLCRFLPYGRITSTSDITFRQKTSAHSHAVPPTAAQMGRCPHQTFQPKRDDTGAHTNQIEQEYRDISSCHDI